MTSERYLSAATIMICMIAICAALSVAGSVFAPITFALLIIALLWPFQRLLQTFMPKLLALAFSVICLVIVLTTFGSLIAWGFGRVARWVLNDAARFQAAWEQLALWLDGHGIVVAALWADTFNVGWLVRAAQSVSARLNTTLSFWVVVLVYVMLGLLEVDDFARKIRMMENPVAGRVLLRGSVVTAAKIRRYMLVRTQMSVITGLMVFGLASLIGLPLAKEWGVIAFVLNYIPFIGPLLATLFPTALAVVEFQDWRSAALVFAALNLIQFSIGSYLEPRVSGNALSISPFLVLFAVFFWTYLWGIFGAFIGVPITIAILTFCDQHDSTRWLAQLFGSADDQAQNDRSAEI